LTFAMAIGARGIVAAAGSRVALTSGAAITVRLGTATAGAVAVTNFGNARDEVSKIGAGAAVWTDCAEAVGGGLDATGGGVKRAGSGASIVGAACATSVAGDAFRNVTESTSERLARLEASLKARNTRPTANTKSRAHARTSGFTIAPRVRRRQAPSNPNGRQQRNAQCRPKDNICGNSPASSSQKPNAKRKRRDSRAFSEAVLAFFCPPHLAAQIRTALRR